jgi:hypothetical protein
MSEDHCSGHASHGFQYQRRGVKGHPNEEGHRHLQSSQQTTSQVGVAGGNDASQSIGAIAIDMH